MADQDTAVAGNAASEQPADRYSLHDVIHQARQRWQGEWTYTVEDILQRQVVDDNKPGDYCTCLGILGHTRDCPAFDESMMRTGALLAAPAATERKDMPMVVWKPEPDDVEAECLDNSLAHAASMLRSTGHEGNGIDASRLEYLRAQLDALGLGDTVRLDWLIANDAMVIESNGRFHLQQPTRPGNARFSGSYSTARGAIDAARFGRSHPRPGSEKCVDMPASTRVEPVRQPRLPDGAPAPTGAADTAARLAQSLARVLVAATQEGFVLDPQASLADEVDRWLGQRHTLGARNG